MRGSGRTAIMDMLWPRPDPTYGSLDAKRPSTLLHCFQLSTQLKLLLGSQVGIPVFLATGAVGQ